jgi:hypothetical protein
VPALLHLCYTARALTTATPQQGRQLLSAFEVSYQIVTALEGRDSLDLASTGTALLRSRYMCDVDLTPKLSSSQQGNVQANMVDCLTPQTTRRSHPD